MFKVTLCFNSHTGLNQHCICIMNNPLTISSLLIIIIISCSCISDLQVQAHAVVDHHHDEYDHGVAKADLVRRDERKPLVETEYGEISAVEITPYSRLHFFTLEPNSLFLPVLLHYDMFFYVHTGSGKLSWTDEDDMREVDISRGDVHTLKSGSVFYVESSLDSQRQKLRFYAYFSISNDYHYQPSIGAYSRLSGMVKGFDGKVLQAAFKVPEGAVEEITSATRPPAIIHAVPSRTNTKKASVREWEARFMKAILGGRGYMLNSKKKYQPFNVFDAKPDVENCNGWSLSVNKKHLMKGSNVGVFMVNLTKGSMMGPHWNPMATEVSIVLRGKGMVRIACPTDLEDKGCKSRRFKVEEGDVFVVPRFYPMAQISFNNESLVFLGFSTWANQNHPQFLAGKRSVLQVLDKGILAASFNVTNSTIGQFVNLQEESIILECTSCAEEEEMKMEEEEARKREEEARKKEEEEARKKEEEEARKREEEERKRKEEEEARKREEEEARKREEEARKREEEEEARKREEEEEARKREEEEEAEARKREEEEARKREEEEEARKREEDEARKREEEEEEARKREEEEEAKKWEEEEEARKWKEEEAMKREEEEAMKREKEEEEKAEARKREEEEEAESRKREEEEESRKWEEEEEEEEPESEQEAAWREEEERVERQRQQEKAWKEREKQQEEADWQQEQAAAPARIDNVYSAAPRLRALKLSRFMV